MSLSILQKIRTNSGPAKTKGIADDLLESLIPKYNDLRDAISTAAKRFDRFIAEEPQIVKMSEEDAVASLQESIINFYPETQVNPYVAIAAQGPWIVTLHGAVLHDSGGYGMLGFGHGPKTIQAAMNDNHVMANIMTPSLSHKRITDRLQKEIGHNRKDQPFSKFLFMNSGSEAVTVAFRISDLNAKSMTDPGGAYAGRTIKILAHVGGFHGRTDRPAQASDSSLKSYQKLASFCGRRNLVTVEVNNIEQLRKAFADADANNEFFEMVLMEPVMGEGNPGVAIEPAYYAEAQKLASEHGSLFLVDSIQAGLRATGNLSIVDYPGFESLPPPDFETYSKALNAGQYPLSVLGMTKKAAALYARGIYGNTMTGNPRALEVGCAVLDSITDSVRANIKERGKDLLNEFAKLKSEFPGVVTGFHGTGLLCALDLNPDGYPVVGTDGVELYLRHQGIGVIHGGKNALRFTPHFNLTRDEVDLIIEAIRKALKRGPVYQL